MLVLPYLPDAGLILDGLADEAAWSSAVDVPDPTPFWPNADVAPVGSVRTRLLADAQNLYVHFEVVDPEPALVRSGLGRRDSRFADDYVGIHLDPGAGGRRSYTFVANPLGVQTDGVHPLGEASYDPDHSWDGLWTSAGRPTPTGWAVEMAIPWATVQISGDAGTIGLVVVRQVARKSHTYAWPKVEPNTDPLLWEARVEGPAGLPRRLGLELLPELTGAWNDPPADSGRLNLYGVAPGLTLRYAPTPGFSSSVTANPDFSQIESDSSKIEVNQRYALSYDEKRPFFLEGQDALDQPFPHLYYSRSMNAPLYGARVLGEAGPVSVAALHVLDMAPPPSVNEGGGWSEADVTGQQALASVARARVSMSGGSSVGLFASDRTFLEGNLSSRVLGVDGTARLSKNLVVDGSLLGSATTFAEDTTPRLAPAGRLSTVYSTDKVYVMAKASLIAPDFRQENGFVTTSDAMGGGGEAHYEFQPGGAVPMLAIEPADGWAFWTLDGEPRERAWDPSVWCQFDDGSFLKLDGRVAGESFAGTWVDYARAELYAYTTLGSWLRLDSSFLAGTSPYYDPADPRAGVAKEAWVGLNLQPLSSFIVSLSPGVAHLTELSGEQLNLAWTGRAKVEAFFTRRAWFRTVADVRGAGEAVDAWRIEPLAAYEWTPGRAVYLGGAYGEEAAPYWQVFAKLSWRFSV